MYFNNYNYRNHKLPHLRIRENINIRKPNYSTWFQM